MRGVFWVSGSCEGMAVAVAVTVAVTVAVVTKMAVQCGSGVFRGA